MIKAETAKMYISLNVDVINSTFCHFDESYATNKTSEDEHYRAIVLTGKQLYHRIIAKKPF